MSILKDIAKMLSKVIDEQAMTNLYPNLINRNYNEKSFLRNDYEVDDNVEYIFMHIPKTGGMTLQNLLNNINKNNEKKFFVGAHNPVSLFHNTNQKKYITIFRDPIERVYSFYNMNLNDKKQIYHYLAKKGLYNFVKFCPEVQNTYCQYFSGYIEKDVDENIFNQAVQNFNGFYEIIDFKKIDEQLIKFFDKINMKIDEIPHINKKSHSDANKEISKKNRSIIEFFNVYDLKLYQLFKIKSNQAK